MALTKNVAYQRRGPARGDNFGYYVAPGEVIYAGSLFGVNAAGYAVRIQTAGIVQFVGMALNGVDNSAGSTPSAVAVVASQDTWALTIAAGGTPSNINAKVYATDDNTLTLAQPGAGFTGVVGYFQGIDNGQTYVKVQGH